ncbi:MAG: cob(I)yrinic acid a,c-diamide adenosyltransferase [Chloroflexi bacterium]|nr:cob(I)yrinic acid a,c-diamide adenosyltransferase [Chloroflexota bacterium]MBI3763307.1 cob(I)yrinic acid a,c-diamide adenosyltransferase [Chloroflexota bacterium]
MWRGDLGLTDLIDRQDVPKFDLRFEVLGALDEASSALGLVRAGAARAETKELVLAVQRDLCWLMSELAAVGDEARPESHIDAGRLEFLESEFQRVTAGVPLGDAFVVPGDTQASAALQLARAIIRRAERQVTLLDREAGLPNPNIIAYLNRLSALVYALARAEDAASGAPSTIAHPSSNGHR